MHSNRLRAAIAALLTSLALGQTSLAQGTARLDAASGHPQFPQIPLHRDAGAGRSIAGTAVWTALFLGVLAAAGFVLVRRRGLTGFTPLAGWLPPAAGASNPKALARISLTQNASLHVVQWQGEELLLACTPQSVALLARRDAATAGVDASGSGGRAQGQT